MKIQRQQLEKIIKEEINNILRDGPRKSEAAHIIWQELADPSNTIDYIIQDLMKLKKEEIADLDKIILALEKGSRASIYSTFVDGAFRGIEKTMEKVIDRLNSVLEEIKVATYDIEDQLDTIDKHNIDDIDEKVAGEKYSSYKKSKARNRLP